MFRYGYQDDDEEMERDIGMRALQDTEESKPITPLIEPLACSLHSSLLSTHCYACFCRIDAALTHRLVKYCSEDCKLLDSVLYDRSGEHELMCFLHDNPDRWPVRNPIYPDSSYLRLALRMLLILPPGPVPKPYDSTLSPPAYYPFPTRFLGLSCINENYISIAQTAGFLMTHATSLRLGRTDHLPIDFLAIRVFTMVFSNALQIDIGSLVLGVALYDFRISWINHSCDPNSFVSFVAAFEIPASGRPSSMLIGPSNHTTASSHMLPSNRDVSAPCIVSDLPEFTRSYGPRAFIKTIRAIREGEEVTISYVDSSQPRGVRLDQLSQRYVFTCICSRCMQFDEEYEVSGGSDVLLAQFDEQDEVYDDHSTTPAAFPTVTLPQLTRESKKKQNFIIRRISKLTTSIARSKSARRNYYIGDFSGRSRSTREDYVTDVEEVNR